jgi:elongation factor 1 alpha-like protein
MSRHRFIRNKKYSSNQLSDEDISYDEEEDDEYSGEEGAYMYGYQPQKPGISGKEDVGLPKAEVVATPIIPSKMALNLNSRDQGKGENKTGGEKTPQTTTTNIQKSLFFENQTLKTLVQTQQKGESDIKPFDFSSPSPDDIVLQKQGQAFKKKKDEPVNLPFSKSQKPIDEPKVVPKFQGKARLVEQQKRTVTSQPMLSKADSTPTKKEPISETISSPSSNNTNKTKQVKQHTEAKRKQVIEKMENEKKEGMKENINVVVIGHVDSGKSTIMGHLLYLSGYVTDKTIHRYTQDSADIGKSSFAFAWVLDEYGEERERGVTIDVGVRSFQTQNKKVTILDAPGHKEFIPNMITGAAVADVGLLVINSIEGEFEKGFRDDSQTKEHVILAKSLGITSLIVAVNKLDCCAWSEKRFNDIKSQLSPFLQKSGFKNTQVKFIPCSGLLGINLTQNNCEDLKKWYNGVSITEAIDQVVPPERPILEPFILPVSDVYKDSQSGMGICVAGRVERGFVAKGDNLLVLPTNEICQVKSIKFQNQHVDYVHAGQNVDIGLINVNFNSLFSGCVLCDPENPVSLVQEFTGQILTFSEMPLLRGQQVTFHLQSLNEQATVVKLINILNPKTLEAEKTNPKCLLKQTMATVLVRVDKQICATLFTNCRALGRFTLRDKGKTLAAGIITKF